MGAGLPPGYTVDSPTTPATLPKGYSVDPPTTPDVRNLPGGDVLSFFKPKPGAFMRNAPPIAAMTAGQLLGGAVGDALAPETGGLSLALPLVLRALAAGAGNVAAKNLPEKFGGTPNESNKAAFLWGAGPSIVGDIPAAAVSSRLASKAAQATAEDTAKFETQAAKTADEQRKLLAEHVAGPPTSRADVARAGHLLGSRTGAAAPTLAGEDLTAATNEATDAVLGPVNRMRETLGKPIGAAYKNLKGGDQRLTPDELSKVSESTQQVREDLISPAPAANATFRQLQRAGVMPESGSEFKATESQFGGAETIGRGANRAIAPSSTRNLPPSSIAKLEDMRAKGQPITPEVIARLASEHTETPTYNEIRELRQYVNSRLQTAKGGDSHALRGLQNALDNVLVEHLPDNMQALRTSYRGFIKRYPWNDVNQLRRMGTPEEVGQWLFSREPAVTNEIIQNATPRERAVYQQLFAQNTLSKIDPNAPPQEQFRALRSQVAPYLKSGTAQRLYGSQTAKAVSDLVHLPLKRQAAARILTTPAGARQYAEGFMAEAHKSGEAGRAAVMAGYQKWFNALPPELQDTVSQVVQPTAPIDAAKLPSPRQSLQARLKPTVKSYIPRFAIASALGASAGMALGAASGTGGQFMIRATLGFALMNAGTAAYTTFMETAGAPALAALYSNPSARALGAATYRTLVNAGGRAVHQEAQDAAP